VHSWEISTLELLGESGFFEWSFACTWQGERYEFEGASVFGSKRVASLHPRAHGHRSALRLGRQLELSIVRKLFGG